MFGLVEFGIFMDTKSICSWKLDALHFGKLQIPEFIMVTGKKRWAEGFSSSSKIRRISKGAEASFLFPRFPYVRLNTGI